MQLLGAGVGGPVGVAAARPACGTCGMLLWPRSFSGRFSYICRGRSSGGLGSSCALLAAAAAFSSALHSLYLILVYSRPSCRLFCNGNQR